MKHLLLTTIAAVLVVGCGESQLPEPPTAKAPNISIYDAARRGDIVAVKQHIAAGTDVNVMKIVGLEALTPLRLAAQYNQLEVVELLIAEGADVDERVFAGTTSLFGAVHKGHKEIAKLLIEKGADVNAKDDFGRTPLDLTIQKSRTETADLLRKHGGKTGKELKAEGKY